MEKTISLSVRNTLFFKACLQLIACVNDEDIFKKMEVYSALKPLSLDNLAEEINGEVTEEKTAKSLSEVSFKLDSEAVDFLKAKWKEVPAKYILRNSATGEVVQTGFSTEDECNGYADIKKAIDSAVPVLPKED